MFAVVSDSFWKHTGLLGRTVNSISRKICMWSVKDNSYQGSDRTMETDRTFGSNQCELPRSRPVRTMESQCKLMLQWGQGSWGHGMSLKLCIIFAAYGLECYVCTGQEHNDDKCTKTVNTCLFDQTACMTRVEWRCKCPHNQSNRDGKLSRRLLLCSFAMLLQWPMRLKFSLKSTPCVNLSK